jgi:hypothetical protein
MPRTGRPPKYNRSYGPKIIAAMATGLSLDAAAAEIGVSPRTAYQWQRDMPEFSQAVEEGRAKALAFWEKRAIAVASGKPGNAAIISLGLRNRSRAASGWHEAVRAEHSGPDGQPVQVEQRHVIAARNLTYEQRQTLRQLLLVATSGAT